MNELIFCPQICIPLPDNEEDIKNKNYLKKQVEEISKKIPLKNHWKDLISDMKII